MNPDMIEPLGNNFSFTGSWYTVRGKLGSVKKSPVTPGVTGAVRL